MGTAFAAYQDSSRPRRSIVAVSGDPQRAELMVHPPDQKGRVAILKVHTRTVPLANDVDLEQLASSTPGMS